VGEEFDSDHQSSGSDSDAEMGDADSDAAPEAAAVPERPKKKQKTSK
jgi:structure-specific recognition protein 1